MASKLTLTDAINEASRAGFKVHKSTETPGWLVTTPKRPRRPSEEHGDFHTEDRAWFAACLMSRD